jgi:iron complex outermembrane receptor protein
MSPSIVGMVSMTFRPFVKSAGSLKSMYATLSGKYVGKQFYDNTSSDERSIPAYFVGDLSLGYQLPLKVCGDSSLSFSFHIHNLLNHHYYADAWLWRAYFKETDTWYDDIGIYPQAPLNMMFKVAYKF